MNRSTPSLFPAAVLAALLAVPLPAVAAHEGHDAPKPAATLPTATEATATLRDLWVDHVFWVRGVVVATIAGNDAAAAEAEKQVVANAHAIAASIAPYYGDAASDSLFQLLAGHYGAVKKVLGASVAADKAGREAALAGLNANATEIARFLSSANPNLPFDRVNALLLAHGAHHLEQIDELRRKDYAAEARTWESMKAHMFVIADALAGAIAKQFPARFR